MVLDSNPIVGVDLGPDFTDHAEKLSQDALPIPLLGTLHALNLPSCGLLHFSRQVPLRAHGRLLLALKLLFPLPAVLLHLHLSLLLRLLQSPGLPLPGIGHLLRCPLLSLEELLAKVDEFVGMLDMIRGDSSHVVGEGVPRIHAKAAEMRRIYGRIDKLEAFVRMIGSSVARMEEQVAKAEAELGTFPRAFRRLLHTISVPALFRSAPSGPQRAAYEPPVLFRTEDHFPGCGDRPQL